MEDEYLWLEDIEGTRSLAWVDEQSEKARSELKDDRRFKAFQEESLRLLQDKEKLPSGFLIGEFYYNIWQDDEYRQGLLRRVPIEKFPLEEAWETVLDLDELSNQESESWVFRDLEILGSEGPSDADGTALLSLSKGGKDAFVIREFDLEQKKFVENGFVLPEGKNEASWLDKDTLLVGADFDNASRTSCGYLRQLKVWRRGESFKDLKKKPPVIKIPETDMACWVHRLEHAGQKISMIHHSIDFYSQNYYVFRSDKVLKLHIPEDARVCGLFFGQVLFHLHSEGRVGGRSYPQDSLLSCSLEQLLEPSENMQISTIVSPSKKRIFQYCYVSKACVLIKSMEDVVGVISAATFSEEKGWSHSQLALPAKGNTEVIGASANCEASLLAYESFVSPVRVFRWDSQLTEVFSLSEKFEASGIEVRQEWATSEDGSKIPYFICGKLNSGTAAPTLLYGYGGFQVSLPPSYNSQMGKLWMEQGGIFVLANIRGGGEFGSDWHQCALKTQRHKCYEDFAAIAEDVIAKGWTDSAHLGISGGSNGGLLMGAMLTRRPELFKAVLCDVPLLDMIRYTQLLAGSSWVAEYGDAEESEEMRDYLLSYSPYQNVKTGVKYPRTFFYTSTKDDRVHPGHARKMAAKMMKQGHDVLYLENTKGGHGRNVDLEQTAEWHAMRFAFLWQELGDTQKNGCL